MKRRAFLTGSLASATAVTAPSTAEVDTKTKTERAQFGDPVQTETAPATTTEEAIKRRVIRQAIITKMIMEAADEILTSGARVTLYHADGRVRVHGTLRKMYATEPARFPKLRQLIADPERSFNEARDALYSWWREQSGAPATARDLGSINLVVFRQAMGISTPPDIEEIAQRIVIRSGKSGHYKGSGFFGCK